jgi:hypothetical protein
MKPQSSTGDFAFPAKFSGRTPERVAPALPDPFARTTARGEPGRTFSYTYRFIEHLANPFPPSHQQTSVGSCNPGPGEPLFAAPGVAASCKPCRAVMAGSCLFTPHNARGARSAIHGRRQQSMTAFLYFIAGYMTATAIALALAYKYWLGAKRRIRQIEAHIANYRNATSTVTEALDKLQPRKP